MLASHRCQPSTSVLLGSRHGSLTGAFVAFGQARRDTFPTSIARLRLSPSKCANFGVAGDRATPRVLTKHSFRLSPGKSAAEKSGASEQTQDSAAHAASSLASPRHGERQSSPEGSYPSGQSLVAEVELPRFRWPSRSANFVSPCRLHSRSI